ncbi:unnamed protein product [Linum trigynum]|uniref:Peptidase A1 domain-containing protein n=1 Tax=Linum trigynum TaxID=586398 RepID=A0AAV2DUR4_9ROSI
MAALTSFLPLLLLAAALLLSTPAASTSRRLTQLDPTTTTAAGGFQVALTHVDSGKNLTKFQRLQRGINRGNYRLQKLTAMVLAQSTPEAADVAAPVVSGNGEFLMELAVGTPPVSYSAIVDTGSDLIWTQCDPCTNCYKQPTPIFDPSKSSTFAKLPCSSTLCSALPQSSCGSDGCDYLYTYGDYSSTQGVMATETFTFGGNKVKVPKVGFGCGEDNEGDGFTQGGGLVGLGRGPLSLVSQLKQPKFSYCLTSIDDAAGATSTLSMGSLAGPAGNSSATTGLIQNSAQSSFYYISLEGISVGGTGLSIPASTFALQSDGSGGMIIDSGTTITYLERSAFDEVKKAFKAAIDLPVDNSGSTGLDLCFDLPSGGGSGDIKVPTLVFHFKGADLELPAENYMIADSSVGLVCLAMGSSSGMSIFGNIQQQNFMVLYDLAKESLSFTPTQCAKS